MRILQITPNYPPDHVGGVELHVEGLARTLAVRGHDVAVLHRTADPTLPEFGVQETHRGGVRLYRLCHRFGRTQKLLDLFRNPSVDAAAGTVLAAFRPDAVHAHHFTTLSVSILEEIDRRGVPSIVSLHDYWLGCPRGQMLREDGQRCEAFLPDRCHPCLAGMWPGWFEEGTGEAAVVAMHGTLRNLLATPAALVTPSRFHRDRYVAFGWIDETRTRIVPYGIAESPPVPPRSSDEPFRFGFLGTVIPSKGVHVLLEAFARFPRDEVVALEVHGEAPGWHQDTTYADRCRALVAGDDRVRFAGRFDPDDTPRLLARFDALVVPSIWEESYCIVAREGFRAGVPVVVADFGAAREEIRDGVEALVVPRGDVAALHGAMARLREDQALRRRLVDSPKRLLSIDENTTRLEDLYREVLDERGRIRDGA